MKTLKLTVMVLCLLFYVSRSVAQTYYYNESKTFYESGYTYRCSVHAKLVTLFNSANQRTFSEMTYKDGKPLGDFLQNKSRAFLLQEDTWTKPKAYSIVNGAFTAAEKQRLRGRTFLICMFINPDTGKVMEINFRFASNAGFATIPVSVYRKIEVNLKSQIWFTPTKEAKQLNHVLHFWRHEVE